MNVEVIAVGTELLLGQIVNSNASRIGERLAEAGLDHYRQTVVGDNIDRMAAAIVDAASRADALIITGGLGPTKDDLTREALAQAAGVPLVLDDAQGEALREWWLRRGREMPESNLQQAEKPEGAEFIENPKGTAPGIRVEIDGATAFALPGVPAEMLWMLDHEVIPTLAETGEGVVASRLLRSWGESESAIGERLADLYDASSNPTIAFLASGGEIKVRITAKAASPAAAEALIAPVEAEIRDRLGDLIFGADDDTIEVVVLRAVEGRGWTLGTAESATGGMVASRITAVPGASRVYRGSIVTYTNALKESLLGVDPALIAEHGVVSEPVAEAMAEGARSLLGVDVAVGVTGSAGPDPLEQPQGTMAIAVATPEETLSRSLRFPGDRERVRVFAATAALQWLRMMLEGMEWTSR
jgi:nicotinamide-nucleotide amidase